MFDENPKNFIEHYVIGPAFYRKVCLPRSLQRKAYLSGSSKGVSCSPVLFVSLVHSLLRSQMPESLFLPAWLSLSVCLSARRSLPSGSCSFLLLSPSCLTTQLPLEPTQSKTALLQQPPEALHLEQSVSLPAPDAH